MTCREPNAAASVIIHFTLIKLNFIYLKNANYLWNIHLTIILIIILIKIIATEILI